MSYPARAEGLVNRITVTLMFQSFFRLLLLLLYYYALNLDSQKLLDILFRKPLGKKQNRREERLEELKSINIDVFVIFKNQHDVYKLIYIMQLWNINLNNAIMKYQFGQSSYEISIKKGENKLLIINNSFVW